MNELQWSLIGFLIAVSASMVYFKIREHTAKPPVSLPPTSMFLLVPQFLQIVDTLISLSIEHIVDGKKMLNNEHIVDFEEVQKTVAHDVIDKLGSAFWRDVNRLGLKKDFIISYVSRKTTYALMAKLKGQRSQ